MFFDDEKNVEKLRAIIAEWEGTPYRHRCGVKNKGADCIHFVVKVLVELGVLTWRENLVPDYPRDWHLHNTRDLLLEHLALRVPGALYLLAPLTEEKIIEVEVLTGKRIPREVRDVSQLKNGDIVLMHYGHAASHAGIYLDSYLWQSLAGAGVCRIHISDRAQRRGLRYYYRVEGRR